MSVEEARRETHVVAAVAAAEGASGVALAVGPLVVVVAAGPEAAAPCVRAAASAAWRSRQASAQLGEEGHTRKNRNPGHERGANRTHMVFAWPH